MLQEVQELIVHGIDDHVSPPEELCENAELLFPIPNPTLTTAAAAAAALPAVLRR